MQRILNVTTQLPSNGLKGMQHLYMFLPGQLQEVNTTLFQSMNMLMRLILVHSEAKMFVAGVKKKFIVQSEFGI